MVDLSAFNRARVVCLMMTDGLRVAVKANVGHDMPAVVGTFSSPLLIANSGKVSFLSDENSMSQS